MQRFLCIRPLAHSHATHMQFAHSLVPRLSPSQTHVDALNFAPVAHMCATDAKVNVSSRGGEPGDEANMYIHCTCT